MSRIAPSERDDVEAERAEIDAMRAQFRETCSVPYPLTWSEPDEIG